MTYNADMGRFCLIDFEFASIIESGEGFSLEELEQIAKVNRDLEARVQKRTSELKKTNEYLKKEIKARQAVQVELQKSEEKYRRIVTTTNEAIFVTDEAFNIERISFGELKYADSGGAYR